MNPGAFSEKRAAMGARCKQSSERDAFPVGRVGESQAFFRRRVEQLSQGDSGAEGHLVGGKIDVDNLVEELCADGQSGSGRTSWTGEPGEAVGIDGDRLHVLLLYHSIGDRCEELCLSGRTDDGGYTADAPIGEGTKIIGDGTVGVWGGADNGRSGRRSTHLSVEGYDQ